jgi:hypothetical protein
MHELRPIQRLRDGRVTTATTSVMPRRFSTSIIGTPAVPEGSPSSEDRAWSPVTPVTMATQLCRASQYRFRIPAMNSSASATDPTGSRCVMNRDLLISISCSTRRAIVAG